MRVNKYVKTRVLRHTPLLVWHHHLYHRHSILQGLTFWVPFFFCTSPYLFISGSDIELILRSESPAGADEMHIAGESCRIAQQEPRANNKIGTVGQPSALPVG